MDTHQFSHRDKDGVDCTVLGTIFYGVPEVDIRYVGYDTVDESLMLFIEENARNTCRLLVTDICPKKAIVARAMHEWARDTDSALLLVDHHVTSSWIKEYDWAVHSTDACATKLFLEFLLGHVGPDHSARSREDELREFVEVTDAYDRWLLDSPHRERSEALNRLLYFWGFERYVKKMVPDLRADQTAANQEIIHILEDSQKQKIERTLDKQLDGSFVMTDRDGLKYAMLVASGDVSLLCHAALDRYPELDFVVNVNPMADKADLRSRDGGPDVSKIASRVPGGGGHANAAGFQLSFRDILKVTVRGVF